MPNIFNAQDELNRRAFLSRIAYSTFGVSVAPLFNDTLAAPSGSGKAKAVVLINANAGMSHIDTFDIKPNKKEVQGPVEAIDTKVDGIQISQYLPKTAAVMDRDRPSAK